ncbi:MAG: hypothetical protein K0R11_2394 [Acidimicrobiales bacterium]|nr:hypothetical protein [Acidimicrobiales bacterium]
MASQLDQREVGDAAGEVVRVLERPLVEQRVATPEGGEEDVLVAPEDALRHARRPTGVGAEDVVRAAPLEAPLGGGGGQGLLVPDHPVGYGLVGPVLDDHQVVQLGQAGGHRRHPRAELPGEEDGHEVGVVEEVVQLPLDVAVVDVDGDGPQLERGQHPLEVLGAVEQLEADVVARPHPRHLEVVGQPVGPLVELGVGQAPGRRGDRLPVGDGVDHPLEQLAQVVGHQDTARTGLAVSPNGSSTAVGAPRPEASSSSASASGMPSAISQGSGTRSGSTCTPKSIRSM